MEYVAILAGGSGTRFWPKSRAARPKQFLAFGGGAPLLVETFRRTRLVAPPERTFVVTSAAHADECRRLLPELPPEQVIGEPAARDTAAAIGLAALLVQQRDPAARLLVAPADHRIDPPARFVAAARAAGTLLDERPGALVVFGIRPHEPSTGYGYVELGEPLGAREGLACHVVRAFHEKPALARAQEYLASGRFLWNAGLFAFRAGALQAELARQMPGLARGLAELAPSAGTPRFAAELARVYPGLERRSFDHGVLEHARERLLVVPDYAWDDVGSFAALARAHPADPEGNVVLGQCVALGARGNIVDAGDGLVALAGVEDLIVVHTDDVTLVCRRDQGERIKQLLEEVRSRQGLERHL